MTKTLTKSELDPAKAKHDYYIPARSPWTGIVKKGQYIRIVDLGGQQSADTLFYAAGKTDERYSAQDTLAEQGSAYVTTGTKLISNEGNLMATMVADTSGDHDTSAGACSVESNTVRFGQQTRYMHACRENFLMGLQEYSMGKRDLVSNINFYMNVPILPDGELAIVDGMSKPEDYVELRAEMDLMCLISACPQVNNPCNGFTPTPLRVLIWDPQD